MPPHPPHPWAIPQSPILNRVKIVSFYIYMFFFISMHKCDSLAYNKMRFVVSTVTVNSFFRHLSGMFANPVVISIRLRAIANTRYKIKKYITDNDIKYYDNVETKSDPWLDLEARIQLSPCISDLRVHIIW